MQLPTRTRTVEGDLPVAETKHVLEVSSERNGISRDSYRELWLFREVLWGFLARAVKIRYKQAAIGVGWAVVQPVLAAALFAVFFGRLASIPSEGKPYLLFALAGMVAWTYFSGAVGSASESLVANQSLLRKIYFPRELLPLSAVGASLVDLAPGLLILAIAAGAYGIVPSFAWLATPLLVLILVTFAAAVSIGLSAVNVYYRDVKYALPFFLQIGLFASPIVYSLQSIPHRWRSVYAIANPAAAVIDGFRRVFVHGTWPAATVTFGALVWATLLFVVAYTFFKRLERGFSDRV